VNKDFHRLLINSAFWRGSTRVTDRQTNRRNCRDVAASIAYTTYARLEMAVNQVT